MIQYLKFKNFLSFRDETVISFEASEDKFAQDYQVVQMNDPEKTRLLRLGIIYGYNASGKSNLLKAFDFLKSFWSYAPSSLEEGTKVHPFRLSPSTVNEPTCFELVFFSEDTKYLYQLELDSSAVLKEKLSYYKESQEIMLFERSLQDGKSILKFNDTEGDKVSAVAKEKISLDCLMNMSLFVARERTNVSLPLIDKAKRWIRNHFMPMFSMETHTLEEDLLLAYHDKDLLGYLKDFYHRADFNITDIQIDLRPYPKSKDLAVMSSMSKSFTIHGHGRLKDDSSLLQPEATFIHTVENETGNSSYSVSLSEESKGTVKAFCLATSLYQALTREAFLPIDEIENSLHDKLLENILFMFLSNPSKSQLLITTNNDDLLDLLDDLIRKDSIWFTEKNKTGATDLYKLTDFRGINQLPSIRTAYRNKRFGATIGYGK